MVSLSPTPCRSTYVGIAGEIANDRVQRNLKHRHHALSEALAKEPSGSAVVSLTDGLHVLP